MESHHVAFQNSSFDIAIGHCFHRNVLHVQLSSAVIRLVSRGCNTSLILCLEQIQVVHSLHWDVALDIVGTRVVVNIRAGAARGWRQAC